MADMRFFRALCTLGILLFAAACGDDDGGNGLDAGVPDSGDSAVWDALPDGTLVQKTCTTDGVVVSFVNNHPAGDHKLEVTTADVIAGVDKVYDIQGDNTGHTHILTITAADFASLQDGIPVLVTSGNNGSPGDSHTHEIVLSCA